MPFLSRSSLHSSIRDPGGERNGSGGTFTAPKPNADTHGVSQTTSGTSPRTSSSLSVPPLLRLPGVGLAARHPCMKLGHGSTPSAASIAVDPSASAADRTSRIPSFLHGTAPARKLGASSPHSMASTRAFRPPSFTALPPGAPPKEEEGQPSLASTDGSSSTSVVPPGGFVREVLYPDCQGATAEDLLQRRLEKRRDIDYHQPASAKSAFPSTGEGGDGDAPTAAATPHAASALGGTGAGEAILSDPTSSADPNTKDGGGEGVENDEEATPTSIVSRYPVSLHGKLYFQVESTDVARHDAVGMVVIDVEQLAVMLYDRHGRQYGNRPDPGYPLKDEDVTRAKAGEALKVGTRHVLLVTALCEEEFRCGSFFLRSEHTLRIKEERVKAKEAAEKEKERRACKMTFGVSIGGGKFGPPPLLRKRPRDGETGFIVPLAGRPKRVGDGHGGFLMEELQPLHDPDAAKAVTLFRADYKRDITGRRQVSVVVDPIIGDKLRPHQITGVQFLYQCMIGAKVEGYHGAILADEMGLGKTIQTVATIYTCLKQGRYGYPTARKCIVITPSSLVRNWCNEFDKWLGEGAVKHFAIAESTPKSDRIISRFDGDGDVLVISYDQLRKHIARLSGLQSVELVVCDEGHRLKNAEVKTTKAVDLLPTKNRIILSGTPIQNDLTEFHAMVNFVNPGILGNSELFGRVFEEPILSGRDPEADPHTRALGRDRANYLSTLTSKFILRRTQSINESYLPPKVDITVFVRLGAEQEAAYKRLSCLVLGNGRSGGSKRKEKYHDKDDIHEDDMARDSNAELPCRPLVLISALRKLCNHLDLFHEAIVLSNTPSVATAARGEKNEESSGKPKKRGPKEEAGGIPRSILPTPFRKGDLSQAHGSKVYFVSLMLDEIRQNTARDKLVIVSNFTQTLDIIAALCRRKNVGYFQLDGSTPIKKRQELVDDFNVPFSQEIVFLLSSKAGGVGLNLIGANRLILFDPDWNPANDAQAMGRVWRDGQKKRVFIYRLLSTGTIEEKVYQRQVSKQGLSANVVDMQEDSKQHFTLDELKSLFSFKADTLSETHDLLRCDEQCPVEAAKRKKQLMANQADGIFPPSGFRQVAGEGSRQAAKQSGPRMDELKAWKHVDAILNFQLDSVIRAMAEKAPTLLSFLFADERDNEKKKTSEHALQIERPFAADEESIVCASQAAIQEEEEQETEIEIVSDCSSSSDDEEEVEISD